MVCAISVAHVANLTGVTCKVNVFSEGSTADIADASDGSKNSSVIYV